MGEAIVVGTDGSDTAKRAVAEAVRLACALDAELHVVSAYERRAVRPASDAMGPLFDDGMVESKLAEAAATVYAAKVPVTTHAVRAEPASRMGRGLDDIPEGSRAARPPASSDWTIPTTPGFASL